MKNTDEMVKSLLERREQYETDRNKKKRTLIRTAVPLCCVCLVALIGTAAWKSGIFEKQPAQSANDALYPGIKDWFGPDESESTTYSDNKITVNKIDGIASDRAKLNICLNSDDFVEMSKSELNEYYGTDIFPAVPNDMREWNKEQGFGIYRRNGGTGEVYWDGIVLNYSNADLSRNINIEIKKGSLPVCDYGFDGSAEEKSIINNNEVFLGLSDGGYYYALFMYRSTGFQLVAKGVTQDEFVEVISSLIK